MIKIVKEFPKPKKCEECPMYGHSQDMNATLPYCKIKNDFPDIETCPLVDNSIIYM